ncbi:glycosyltransferase family 4 protein [Mycolicibacterium komossense]|uniref:Glycosyltransferase family 4 protein n=1 Tax=Mycolicibacterium komossense TaxID=1779 RepID=A0ABT3CDF2_9MYCO|nr:glycosyltransferase family 4 protein [Mycolicibacterium komossense]MCV7227510.1 glycosyltransferase family 4 protein [Mycolicibacterium komossense]
MADRVKPRLGMEKAIEALLELLPAGQVELVVITGAPPDNAAYPVTTLDQQGGWRGRLLALRKLRRIAKSRSEAGAVVIAAGSWAFVALAAATVFSDFKLILWEHSILPWRLRNEWRVTIAAVALRLLSFRLQAAVCVSGSNRAAVARIVWPLKQLTVIPNVTAVTGSEPAAGGHNSNTRSAARLVGVGSLIRRKNWELAIRAMQYLSQECSLEIAGAGEEYDRLSALIEELCLTDRVRLLGYVAGGDRLMSDADIVVHPSFAETFGYTMVEAAEKWRPVVVLDMPAMNEMVPIFACGERAKPVPAEFAHAIERARTSIYDYAKVARAREKQLSHSSILDSWNALVSGLKK